MTNFWLWQTLVSCRIRISATFDADLGTTHPENDDFTKLFDLRLSAGFHLAVVQSSPELLHQESRDVLSRRRVDSRLNSPLKQKLIKYLSSKPCEQIGGVRSHRSWAFCLFVSGVLFACCCEAEEFNFISPALFKLCGMRTWERWRNSTETWFQNLHHHHGGT